MGMLWSWCGGVGGQVDGVRWSQRQKREERSYHDITPLLCCYVVGRIIVQYPAHLYSPFLTLTAIPILPFYILYPSSTKNAGEPPLNSNSTHIHFHNSNLQIHSKPRRNYSIE